MRELFTGQQYSGAPFQLFGHAHLIALGVIVLINLGLGLLRVRFTERLRLRFRYGLAALLIVNEFSYHLWKLANHEWTIRTMLPFHLCAVLVYISAAMLISKQYRLYELSYFLGIGGALQALFTPDAGMYGFPHFRFFEMFISHGAIVTAGIYMTVIEGYRPSRKSIVRVVVWVNLYMAFAGLINALLGSNYLWIARKPDFPTL